MKLCTAAMAALLSLGSIQAWAQAPIPDVLSEDVVLREPDEKTPEGWSFRLSLGSTGSFNHSRRVVGSADGSTFALGAIIKGGADCIHRQHVWENSLSLNAATSRTPNVDSFIKSQDDLQISSTYLYRLKNLAWFGPFVRLRMNTQIFNGYDISSAAVVVRRIQRNGLVLDAAVDAQRRIGLTAPFEPIRLRESAGIFANPLEKKELTVKAKAGLGAQHIIVRDGYTVTDDVSTPELELVQLEDATEGGAELEFQASGLLVENVTWDAKLNLFFPVLTTGNSDFDGLEALNTDFSGKISVRLAKWASLDYVLTVKRIPLILNVWQVQNGVLLTTGFDVI